MALQLSRGNMEIEAAGEYLSRWPFGGRFSKMEEITATISGVNVIQVPGVSPREQLKIYHSALDLPLDPEGSAYPSFDF